MISNISVESVIIFLLMLIRQSILDEPLPNLTSTVKDSTTEYPHYGNTDKDYHNDDIIGKLQVETINIKGNNTVKEINETINNDKTSEAEKVVKELKLDEHIEIVENYSRVLNKTSPDSNSMKDAADKLGSLKNGTVHHKLKTKNETTENKTNCFSANNTFCDNDTKKSINSSIQLPNIPKKIDNLLENIPSTTTVPQITEGTSIGSHTFEGDGSLFLNEEVTTESDITTQLVKHIEDVSSSDITKSESSNDGEKYSLKDTDPELEGQSEFMNGVSSNTADGQSTSPSSGFSTSTSSVDFSSVLLQVDSVAHKKPSKQKGSSAHKAEVPDFTKSNGRYFTRTYFASMESRLAVLIRFIFPVASFI